MNAIRFYTPVSQPTSKRESINTERSCCQVLPTDITCTSSYIMRRDPTLPAPLRERNRSKQVRAQRRSILLTDSIPNGAIYMKIFDTDRDCFVAALLAMTKRGRHCEQSEAISCRQLSTPTFLRSINSKSIWAPRPGSVGAWT